MGPNDKGRKHCTAWMSIALLLSCAAAPASGETLFINGVGVAAGTNPFQPAGLAAGALLADTGPASSFIAQDFELSGSASLTGLTLNVLTSSSSLPPAEVRVRFYRDDNGHVGDAVFSQDIALAPEPLMAIDFFDYSYSRFTVPLPQVALPSGVYWLGLQIDPSQFNMNWVVPASGTYGSSGWQSNSDMADTYTSQYGLEHSFALSGIPMADTPLTPLPAAVLGGVALMGGLGMGRRPREAGARQ